MRGGVSDGTTCSIGLAPRRRRREVDRLDAVERDAHVLDAVRRNGHVQAALAEVEREPAQSLPRLERLAAEWGDRVGDARTLTRLRRFREKRRQHRLDRGLRQLEGSRPGAPFEGDEHAVRAGDALAPGD